MKETVSALFDGELDAVEMDRVCARLKDEPDLRDAWDSYALIGDALRGTTRGALPRTFSERLAAEPTVLAPRASPAPVTPRRAARYALSAAAGLAAVSFVSWMALSNLQGPGGPLVADKGQPQPAMVAQPQPSAGTNAPTFAATAAEPSAIPVARGAAEYILAHQRFSPAFALQGVAPFVRTVADEQGGGR
ncbi:MAG: sigma-E factor negative regulatory protein [Burkholderiales bacterium]